MEENTLAYQIVATLKSDNDSRIALLRLIENQVSSFKIM